MWERIERFPNRLTGLGDRSLYGLVLSGGGARAAYQAGVMQYISDSFPEQQFPIMTGVSAGSLNVAHLANNTAGLRPAVSNLVGEADLGRRLQGQIGIPAFLGCRHKKWGR